MASAPKREITSIWTPANIVTCVRIIFIPIYMAFSLLAFSALGISHEAQVIVAFVLYVILSLTDKVDGHLARSRGEITDFGKFLDPIADKLLVFSALLIFIEQGKVASWVVFIILFREFLVSALRMVASANGVVVAADKLGKWKTAVTMVSICGYLLSDVLMIVLPAFGGGMLLFSGALMFVAVVLTVVSGAQYFWNCRNVIFRV
ncbi:MAG: CDP-diacylglycerol--glycerol-3-phosphate 3-phosphatidyltransferase [Collinsella sp.]|nr:CDP-diacylglycerol--glycerol-3-phosphate 3-phosphatidyltransferase [Collinsella sp.]